MATATAKGSTERALREIIGDEATERLIADFGYDFVYFPQPDNIGPDHPIAQCVGLGAAQRLAAEYQGQRLLIPGGYRQRLARRNEAIRQRSQEGATVTQLARAFVLSPRQVHHIIGPRSASPTEGAATR